jgi:hypothetical protein
MALDTSCHEDGTYSVQMLGAAAGRSRKGSAAREFVLCENHSQLVAQVDGELMEEGWSTSFASKPRFIE